MIEIKRASRLLVMAVLVVTAHVSRSNVLAASESIVYTDITGSTEQVVTVKSNVSFTKAETINIVIPEKCYLNSSTKSGTYFIEVKGDVQPNIVYRVSPHDDNASIEGVNFLLSNNSVAEQKKPDIWGLVQQDDCVWTASEINAQNTKKLGTVIASEATAGSWLGQITFDVEYEEMYRYFVLDGTKDITAVIKKDGLNGTIHLVANEDITELESDALSKAVSTLPSDFNTLNITDVYVSWADGEVLNQGNVWGLGSEGVNLHFNESVIFE